MRHDTFIAEKYRNNPALKAFLEALPESFETGGEMLWNGRNKIKSFSIDGLPEIVVKRFKHPNIIQKIGYLFRKHKAYKAYSNGLELIKRGIDTPYPVACSMISKGLFVDDAYYICERCDLPPVEDLLHCDDWSKSMAEDIAHFLAKLHRKGILHNDFNDTNVRFRATESGGFDFSVIDINRMDFYDSIDMIPMKERIENMTRFTGRYDLFELVMRVYANDFALSEEWVQKAIEQKKIHDRNWYRKKKILHPFRKK